jgi:hypothetical protein
MSLIVSIVSKNKSYDVSSLDKEISPAHTNLFGFESWRKDLWGHEIMNRLACNLLYSLRETDLYVYDGDVIKLKQELLTVLESLDVVSEHTSIDKISIAFRVNNALEAIRVVEDHLEYAGVVLW